MQDNAPKAIIPRMLFIDDRSTPRATVCEFAEAFS